MKNVMLEKKSGKIKNLKVTKELLERFENSRGVEKTHLCVDCQNCIPSKCVKVNNRIKKTLDDYDFITDGLQNFEDDGKVYGFLVTGCKNFKKDEQKQLTKEEKRRAKKIRRSLRLDYFESGSLNEAILTQAELQEKGLLEVNGAGEKEKKILAAAKERKAKEDIEKLGRSWLDKKDIQKLSEIAKEVGLDAFREEYNRIVDKKYGEEKKKILSKIK